MHGKTLKQFKRLTLVLNEDGQVQLISSNNARALKNWDIVAVQPCTEKIFLQCVQSSYVDLITFNVQEKPFRIQRSVAKQAIDRGIHFEINISQILLYPKSRKAAMTNARRIVEATLGRNIIITSGADQVTGLRSPHDLANLGLFLGLGAASCKEALTTNPKKLISHAATRKTFKGILQITEIPTLLPDEQWIVPDNAIKNQKETSDQSDSREQTDSPPTRKRKRQN
ncbi:uncharacterized protein LOC126317086 [Schistocerca gregaria]|uniref:uncharacterized protein LOC126317086 n=1 Tax=Schistocerca gregaria TaxID=7010 RepID=UPI00211F034A|nr:uncharacterized protein LOC126317086 [Schistocerca gregaria]